MIGQQQYTLFMQTELLIRVVSILRHFQEVEGTIFNAAHSPRKGAIIQRK